MLRFKNLHEAQNTHMTHMEDLLFIDGIVGARQIFRYIAAARDMLAGHTAKSMNFSAKWDGAPALIVGTDPADGRFFVAKKGVFNKTPIVYKTHGDINAAGLPGSLADIFHLALTHLSKLTIPWTAIQGDLLFTRDTLKTTTIDGVEYLLFHPNTIAYAVPINSSLASRIRQSEMGIVWHTIYNGKSLSTLSATFNRRIVPSIGRSRLVWQVDAAFQNQAGTATMTTHDTALVDDHLSTAGSLLRQIPTAPLAAIGENPKALAAVLQFNNAMVRKGTWLTEPQSMGPAVIRFAADLLTTPAGRTALTPIVDFGPRQFSICYQFVAEITQAKLILTRQLDRLALTGTFVQTPSGYQTTNPEGYVASDILSGSTVKLVDRLTFSAQNFDPTIIKGWQR